MSTIQKKYQEYIDQWGCVPDTMILNTQDAQVIKEYAVGNYTEQDDFSSVANLKILADDAMPRGHWVFGAPKNIEFPSDYKEEDKKIMVMADWNLPRFHNE